MPQHLVVRGNNRLPCFFDDQDRHVYLAYLGEYAKTYSCEIHSYVLMTNHVHLLATAREPGAISSFMQVLNRRYSRYANKAHERTGTLYEGRFRSCLVETDRHFLAVMRYIELNPVRAGMVAHPADYRWSSYRLNASGRPSGILTPHPVYLELANAPEDRREAYRRLFGQAMTTEDLEHIRSGISKGKPLK
jgi:putative transposase